MFDTCKSNTCFCQNKKLKQVIKIPKKICKLWVKVIESIKDEHSHFDT